MNISIEKIQNWAPSRALCLRCAAALWPERHKSYTSVIGARKESENENEELKPVGVKYYMLLEYSQAREKSSPPTTPYIK